MWTTRERRLLSGTDVLLQTPTCVIRNSRTEECAALAVLISPVLIEGFERVSLINSCLNRGE
jgi:hypothetical protein